MEKYKLILEKYVDEIKSYAKLYEHVKSGARVMTLANDDNNKVFTIGFRTTPIDDTGVPHIMEHSTLCGSKKFPVKDPFVELIKGSLNTFLNAMTFPDKTVYPVASCNEKDFQNLMEVYLDAVFYPNVYIHEEIFKQEGWHYELENKDSDIIINGVVYNEMKGAFSSPEEVVMRQSRHLLFPDTTYGVESGGDPEFIPELTYENFKNFHKQFYSPANSYIILYGKINMEEKLDWIDKEYLSKFDRVNVDTHIDFQKPFNKIKRDKTYYPVGKEDSLDGKSYYSYNAVIGDYRDSKLSFAFSALTNVLLDMPGAPLKQALLDKGIGKDIFGSYDDEIMQPIFNIIAKDAKGDNLKEFEDTIYSTLKEIVKKGVDKKAILSSLNLAEFRLREGDFGRAPKGLLYSLTSFGTWLYDDKNPFGKYEYAGAFKELREAVNSSYYEDLIEKYLLNNKHVGILEVAPSNTLTEEKDAKLKDKLAKFKASLSKKQIEDLVEDTKKLKEYQATPSSAEDLAKIPQLKLEDLSKETEKLSNVVEDYNGIKVVRHEHETNGIGYLRLLFNTTSINPELVPYLSLLNALLGGVSTKHHTYQELTKDIMMELGGLDFSFTVSNNNNVITPYIVAGAKYFVGKEAAAFKYFKEIILETLFDDKKRIKEILFEAVSGLQMSIQGGGHAIAMQRALSYVQEAVAFTDKTKGVAFYDFLVDLVSHFDERFDDTISKIKEVLVTVFRKENLLVSYTGLDKGFENCLDDFANSLYKDEIKVYTPKFVKNIRNEGFKTPGVVQFCARVGLFDKERYTGAFNVLNKALGYDYLWVKVRVLGGAYGVMNSATRKGTMYFVSYRDPKLQETFKVYEGVLDYIDNFNPTKAEITKYVVGAIGDIDAPLTPRAQGDRELEFYLGGVTYEDLVKERSQVLNVKIEDIKALKSVFKDVLDQNIFCVVGSEKAIDENKELFKETRKLL